MVINANPNNKLAFAPLASIAYYKQKKISNGCKAYFFFIHHYHPISQPSLRQTANFFLTKNKQPSGCPMG
jgi:hypothetical protein